VIAEELGISKKQAQAAIDEERVLVNSKRLCIRRHDRTCTCAGAG